MKIVLCSSEVFPFAKTGGLADVAGALPLALKELGQEVVVVMPKYAAVAKAGIPLTAVGPGVSSATLGGAVKVYFVENDEYFNRPFLYGDKTGDYKDNLERFSFYCTKTLELLKTINFRPDIIHCNDWQTALIPVFLKSKLADDPFFKKTKTVFTIHNLAYQGLFAAEEFASLGLDEGLFGIDGLEFYGKINLLKGGIIFADYITTVSQGYAEEILTKEFGCGLEAVLEKRKSTLCGIINGLDYSVWDPHSDALLFKQYDASALEAKAYNKLQLQKACGLSQEADTPLFGFVGRLAEQKGVDVIAEMVTHLNAFKAQMVILGTGDEKYHTLLEKAAKKNPHRFSLHLKFDEKLAHRIYAACDMFFMPSRYEPCGLGQMISFKYGAVPIVFKTGGLSDTVMPYLPKTGKGDGFVFTEYSKEAFLETVKQALAVFKKKEKWLALVKKIMANNFSWEESARKYVSLFQSLL